MYQAFAKVGNLGAGIGKLLVGGGATLVQVGLSLGALLAALGHTIDVVLFNPKEHIRLALGRIQTCRRIDRQLLSTCLFASVADLIDIALDLINLCRVGIRIGIEALSPLDGHVNRGVGRRCRGILAHIELIVRSRSSAKGIDGRVGAHIGGVKDLSRNGVITRGELILGTLIGRARIVGGKAHRIADFLARSLQKSEVTATSPARSGKSPLTSTG